MDSAYIAERQKRHGSEVQVSAEYTIKDRRMICRWQAHDLQMAEAAWQQCTHHWKNLMPCQPTTIWRKAPTAAPTHTSSMPTSTAAMARRTAGRGLYTLRYMASVPGGGGGQARQYSSKKRNAAQVACRLNRQRANALPQAPCVRPGRCILIEHRRQAHTTHPQASCLLAHRALRW